MSTLDLKQVNLANLTNTAMTSLTCDDNGKVLMDGEEVVDLSEFGSSLTGNGWQKLPSGLIIQWGTVSVAGNISGNFTVNMPIAFPTSSVNYRAYITVDDDNFSAPAERNPRIQRVNNSTFNFNIALSASGTYPSASWFAIGY